MTVEYCSEYKWKVGARVCGMQVGSGSTCVWYASGKWEHVCVVCQAQFRIHNMWIMFVKGQNLSTCVRVCKAKVSIHVCM